MLYNWVFISSLLWFSLSLTFYCLHKHEKQCRQNFAVAIFIYGSSMTANAECHCKFRGLETKTKYFFLLHGWFPIKFVFTYNISLLWWEINFRSSHWSSVKKVFINISQNSQENVCARVSFLIKLQA